MTIWTGVVARRETIHAWAEGTLILETALRRQRPPDVCNQPTDALYRLGGFVDEPPRQLSRGFLGRSAVSVRGLLTTG
jgi:hypothetical protein